MKERKIALITLSVLIAICVLLSFSYAFYIITLSNRKDIAVTANIPSCAGVMLTSDTKITLTGDNTAPVSDSKALSSTNYRYSFTVSNGCSSAATMKVALAPTTTSTMSPRAIKYAIYESDGSQPSTGSFLSDNGKTLASDIANEVSNITGDTVEYGFEILSTTLNAGASKTYYVYVWVDKDEGGLGNNVTMDSTFYGHLVVTDYSSLGEDYTVPITLAAYIKEASNQTSSQTNGGTYAIVNEGNGLRYEGKDPDNYVCFSDTCTDDTLYRIIGKFTEMVDTDNDGTADTLKQVIKLIKNSSIGNFAYDDDSSQYAYINNQEISKVKFVNLNVNSDIAAGCTDNCGSGQNNWSQASLKNYLNNNWTKPNGNILTTRWYLKSPSSYNTVTASGWQTGERSGSKYGSNSEYWDGKVALMYPSDYGYAVLASNCARTNGLSGYPSMCYNQNWLYLGNIETTITPNASNSDYSFFISNGTIMSTINVYSPSYAVRPAFYLDASTTILSSGDGSKSNPYIISSGSSNVNLISFTIDGTSYQAEEGMTWEQWVANTTYNTNNRFIISNGNVKDSTNNYFLNSNNEMSSVSPNEYISASDSYTSSKSPWF